MYRPQQFHAASKTCVEALLRAESVEVGRLDIGTVFFLLQKGAICLFSQVPPAHSILRKYFAGTGLPWKRTAVYFKIYDKLLLAVPLEAFHSCLCIEIWRSTEDPGEP